MLVYSGQSLEKMDLALYKPSRGTNYIYTKEGRDPLPLY